MYSSVWLGIFVKLVEFFLRFVNNFLCMRKTDFNFIWVLVNTNFFKLIQDAIKIHEWEKVVNRVEIAW